MKHVLYNLVHATNATKITASFFFHCHLSFLIPVISILGWIVENLLSSHCGLSCSIVEFSFDFLCPYRQILCDIYLCFVLCGYVKLIVLFLYYLSLCYILSIVFKCLHMEGTGSVCELCQIILTLPGLRAKMFPTKIGVSANLIDRTSMPVWMLTVATITSGMTIDVQGYCTLSVNVFLTLYQLRQLQS